MPLTNRQRASVDRWIPRSQRKARGTATGGRDASAAPAHRLAYYATTLPGKENWHQTDEGYRTYTNVPICRTGSQLYLGRELKKNEGYNPAWGLRDDEMVEVFCPVEELTSRETLASFETKSVLDEHPFGDKILVNALDEYDGISKGTGHNVRVGDVLDEGEFAGETPLIADLTVKHPDLNVKIEGGIREVSCAYTFSLDKDAAGRFVKRKIRGNHIAVVPKGRAGPEIGIKDSAPPSTTTANTGAKMKNLLKIVGLGFQNFAKDAKPEEVGELLEQMREGDGVADAAVVDTKSKAFTDAVASGVKDAMAAKDAEEEAEKKKKEDDEKAAKDAEKECESMADGEMQMEDKAAKDNAEVIPSMSESIFSVGDAATHLGALRPLIAKSKDKAAIASFNKLAKSVKSLRTGVKDGAPDPFVALSRPSNSAVADAEPELPMFTFFNGVPYEEGLKRWNEHQKSIGAR